MRRLRAHRLRTRASASARSSGVLTLKKGPNGTVDHFGACDALPGSPAFNLPYAFDHEAVAQILA